MKVAIVNAVLSNGGDAAICQAVKAMLERELRSGDQPVEVVVFDSDAAVTSGNYPSWRVLQQLSQAPPRRSRAGFLSAQLARIALVWLLGLVPGPARRAAGVGALRRSEIGRALVELSTCDVVVSTGGTYLTDHYDFTHRWVELRFAKSLGKPVVLWTQSMGPFRTRRSRSVMARIAGLVDGVYCRDAQSVDHWRRATGDHRPVAVVPDAAFALEPPPTPAPSDGSDRPLAILSVREWSRGIGGAPLDRAAYAAAMRAAVTAVGERGWRSRALSTCQGVPHYRYDDSAVARTVFRGLPIDVDAEFHTPTELLEALAGCELLVTTRLHLAILGLVARVPVVAVAYEFKTLALFGSLGLDHAVVRIEDATPEWMRSAVARAVEEPDRFRLGDEQLAALRSAAAAPAALVRELAGATAGRR